MPLVAAPTSQAGPAGALGKQVFLVIYRGCRAGEGASCPAGTANSASTGKELGAKPAAMTGTRTTRC